MRGRSRCCPIARLSWPAVDNRGHNRSQRSAGKHRVDNGPHRRFSRTDPADQPCGLPRRGNPASLQGQSGRRRNRGARSGPAAPARAPARALIGARARRTSIAAVSQTAGRVSVRVPAKINLQLAVGPLRRRRLSRDRHGLPRPGAVRPADRGAGRVADAGGDRRRRAGLPTDRQNLAWQAARTAGRPGRRAGARRAQHRQADPGGGRPGRRLGRRCRRAAGLRPALGAGPAGCRAGSAGWPAGQRRRLRAARRLGGRHRPRRAVAPDPGWRRGFIGCWRWPHGGLSTPAVYAELDRQRGPAGPGPPRPGRRAGCGRGGRGARSAQIRELLAGRLANDLQPAAIALAPYLGATLAAGRDCGALAGIVSGSGPTCAFLARDGEHARTLARALAGSGSCRQALAVAGGRARATVLG